MPDEPMPLPKAARLLGLTPEAVRQRIKRGEIEGFRDNRGRWQVRLGESDQQPLASGLPNVAELADAEAELARWQERAEQVAKRLADRDRDIAELKEALRQRVEELRADLERERRAREEAERRRAEEDRRFDEVLRQIGELREERRQRRPWPGLRRWWRRLLEGEQG